MKQLLRNALNDWVNVAVRLFFSLSISLSVCIYVLLNNERGTVYHIPSPVDAAIPFNKYFIVPYVFWYIYTAAIIFYFAVYDENKYFRMIFGMITGMLVCYLIYFYYPTIVPRPSVYGDDIFAKLVRLIYERDKPYNCFPSIHVLDSVLLAVYINREERLTKKIKIISTLISISIILATMFVKQHYFYDAVSGTILAYSVYVIYNYKEVFQRIQEKTVPIAGVNQE